MTPPQQPSDSDDPDEMVEIKERWGSYRVRRGSFVFSALDPERRAAELADKVERGVMALSLGRFADLLWMLVPESRPIIFEVVRKEFEDAIEYDQFLGPISESKVADEVYREIMLPALRSDPEQTDVLRRCLLVLRRITASGDELYRGIFGVEIIHPLEAEGFRARLAELDPELYRLTKELWGW